jgi:hypothetical protein
MMHAKQVPMPCHLGLLVMGGRHKVPLPNGLLLPVRRRHREEDVTNEATRQASAMKPRDTANRVTPSESCEEISMGIYCV